ncbi:ATP-binding cassette domain-containing protein [Acuticoccus sp. MNP-M23]|uniref:ATP-binding cassette domain-containing protein n=1 Tax=Acuticoccus sp. MNP-M23 TaxID=3072793 RepID=UPI0028156ED0|nr:ATP-binding cassette domain-containing protein [Acuticoccus sp. MNP-M23]WMS41014.1 ATP-binding cassette domain-containing protein [Acuticoccus sp. MNP-M23]
MTLFPLHIEGATVRRGGRNILGPVDLTLGGEGATALIGPNGAGKTTLLRLIHGLARPHGGTVRWAAADAEKRQALVFQAPILLRRTVCANIAYPLRLKGVAAGDAALQAASWAKRIGLGDHLARPATALSGGEAQKLALARALITAPDLLLLDEPTASLDGRAKREIEAIVGAAITEGTRVIIATHDMGQAARLANEVIFLFHGEVHETGPAEPFFRAPQTPAAAAFLRGDIVE